MGLNTILKEIMIKNTPLALEEYRSAIYLDEPFKAPSPASITKQERTEIVDKLLAYLKSKDIPQFSRINSELSPTTFMEKRRQLKALLTVYHSQQPLPNWFHYQMDRLLQYENLRRQVTDTNGLQQISKTFPDSTYAGADYCTLWQGDITTLQVDAIVNAANAQMLGCFQPFHACIDNVIHSAAGPRLREDCATIMGIQGHPEGTSWAKITRGYNLPARFVLHTVGPIIPREQAQVTPHQVEQLANSYRSCLDLASQVSEIRSLAFCCISTGVFGFPQDPAAQIVLDTVATWMSEKSTSIELIVFNVFTDTDYMIYQQKLLT